jgi:NAD(P)-dependent dehydrogenase (short-subunit alcohol dehydrogenase family)
VKKRLEGRVAIVTGAAQGMGRAFADALSDEGAKVVLVDLDIEAVQAVSDAMAQLGRETLGLQADVSEQAQVEGVVRAAVNKFGTVDILVNNAGIMYTSSFNEITPEEWDRTMDVNLKGVFLCTRAVYPILKENGYGRVINISSSAGKTVSTLGGAHYTVSKHGVMGLTKAFAREAASFGITCNAICPGLIDTPMVRSSIDDDKVKEYERGFPVSRLGTPSEVAALVVFLASEESSYITGAGFDINGGDLMV